MNKTFNVTNEHLMLLSRMYVDWNDCEYGAPTINPKRPYGNSFVEKDIAEILGWDFPNEDNLKAEEYDVLSKAIGQRARKIHSQMETVLQILIQNIGIRVGEYINIEEYSYAWVPCESYAL